MPQYTFVCLSVCPPVCLSVTFGYVFHAGWKTSKIISRLSSLRFLLGLTWGDLVQRELPKNLGGIEVGSWAQKPAISLKRWKIGPRLLWRTNRKSHTHFQLVPKSMNLDYLERPKRHSCRNKKKYVIRSVPEKNLTEDRPILSAAKCRPMSDSNFEKCGYSRGFHGGGASNTISVNAYV